MNCGLLGRKLAHSYSPAIHAEFGGYNYKIFEVEPDNLGDFFSTKDFHGINITIPYKQAAMEFCKELSPTAQAIGSVNTILKKPNGDLFGDNTDAAGFRKMVDLLGIPISGKKIIIFGTGGSSLSVVHVMKELGAGEIILVSIEDNNAEFTRRHSDAEILVNCTPSGMYPYVGAGNPPILLEYFPKLCGVFDLVYNPARTWLMMDADEREIPNIGGLPMLVGQAAVSSAIFTGHEIGAEKVNSVINMLKRDMENIVLIGMPGSGKTTHGRLLAQILNRNFIDTDEEIIKLDGRTIPEIFAQEGEEGFRKKETEILAKFGKESGVVIATGGGCVTREENFRHLKQNGAIIFTERSTEELAREGRPLSQGDLNKMYEKRLPMYKKFADTTIKVQGSPDGVVKKILEALDEIFNN
ncbi:MAG: shikimate kinase [Defluviitaleaceae bacterium]|nr:shikimate kinase [Defluviitaleaceae bacterium]